MDTTRNMLAYVQAIDGLNRSDFEAVAQLFADNCEFTTTGMQIGSNRDEILATLKALKEQGWKYHHILSLVAEDEYLTSSAKNESADGVSMPVVGVARFGPDGKITEMRAIGPVLPEPPDAIRGDTSSSPKG